MVEPPAPESSSVPPAPPPADTPAAASPAAPASLPGAASPTPAESPTAPAVPIATPAVTSTAPATGTPPAPAATPPAKSSPSAKPQSTGAKSDTGELIPTAIVFGFIAMLFGFLGYFAYKNLTKPGVVEKKYPLAEQAHKDYRLIPLRQVLHAEKVETLPPDQDSKWLEEKWVENPPGLPQDVIYGLEGRRRHRITYTWNPKKINTEDGEKETIPSLTADWAFGAIYRDKDNRSWPGFPLISKYAYEGDLLIDTTINLPSRAKLMELYTDYIYDGEQTGLKVFFYVPETPVYDIQQGKPLETRIHAQLYLLRYDRYYALTKPCPTTIEPFKDFTLQFQCINRDIALQVNGEKVLTAEFPDRWPEDDSYIGGVPGQTFADGRAPHHAGFIEFKALDFGDQAGKGYVKQLTIEGTPAHIKVNTMRERVWWTDYRPKYLQQQEESGKAEVTPLIPDPNAPPPEGQSK